MMHYLRLSVLFFGIIIFSTLVPGMEIKAQAFAESEEQKKDSIIYFTDLSQLLALRLYTMTKWNSLEIVTREDKLILRPNGPTALGVGFNYKGLGLGLAIGLPKSNSSREKYGETKRFDVQASVYSKRIGLDGYFQIYTGYYNANPKDFIDWEKESFPLIPEMQVMSLGVSAFYILNDEKFSYKAAFVRNQIQHKSAGSLVFGLFGYHDAAKTDNGFIPAEYPDSIRNEFDLKSFKATVIGLTVGYMHTFVIKKVFFVNLTLIPGFGYQRVDIKTLDDQDEGKNSVAFQGLGRTALGYENKHFYIGVSGSIILRNFEYKEYEFDLATQQLRVFVGKRFDVGKKRE